jgi:hypothetical protein
MSKVTIDKVSSGKGSPTSMNARLSLSNTDTFGPSLGTSIRSRSPPSPFRRSSSIRISSSPDRSPSNQHVSLRRSKLASPVFTSLCEKDDPYFLALPDTSRSKILSNSAPDLNTLPHPPPRVHRRPNRDTFGNGNGRLMEQLHSSQRHATIGSPSKPSTDNGSLSRRSSTKHFRLQYRAKSSSGSSNCDSDSESEIFDEDRSNMGSAGSTRPSSFGSASSFTETFLRRSASIANLDGKFWKPGTLRPSFSVLDLTRKQENIFLPERDHIEAEDCRFLESEFHRYPPFEKLFVIVDSFPRMQRNRDPFYVVIFFQNSPMYLHYLLHRSH